MKNYQEYYKQLGNLLYAVASADGNISKKEWKELRRMVSEELVPAEHHNDEFGSDSAYAVEFQFDFLEGNDYTAEMAFEEVVEYLRHNAVLLPAKDKEMLIESANHVAAAFHNVNKEERAILSKLETLLK
jgi:uncharacterized tellurite resistance protein B-like protein